MGEGLKNLHIFKYKGKKGDYYITHINKKSHFVIIKDTTKGKFIDRVNMKTQQPYILYIGEYKVINDLVFI